MNPETDLMFEAAVAALEDLDGKPVEVNVHGVAGFWGTLLLAGDGENSVKCTVGETAWVSFRRRWADDNDDAPEVPVACLLPGGALDFVDDEDNVVTVRGTSLGSPL